MKKRGKRINWTGDQRGFTLVELLIGIVILAIVTAAVCSFIVIGSRSYAAANTEIMLQQEAQLALNQISDVIIDTTSSVNYEGAAVAEDGSYTDAMFAEKDADFPFEPQAKILTMYNGATALKLDADGNPIQELDEEGNPKVDANGEPVYETEILAGEGGNQKHYQFIWEKGTEDGGATLYYRELPLSETDFALADEVVLAEHVTEFSVDLSQVMEKRVVQISMTFEKDRKIYTTSNNITIRNRVQINSKELTALDKKVVLKVRAKDPVVILEPGEEYTFSIPEVSGQNVIDRSVEWELYNNAAGDYPAEIAAKYLGDEKGKPHSAGTQFLSKETGKIVIAREETTESFQVVMKTNATSQPGNKRAYDIVTVYVKRASEVELQKTADENADNGALEVSAGKTFTVSATVKGTKLGVTCGGCTDKASPVYDKDVVSAGVPVHAAFASAYGWKIIKGGDIASIESDDGKSAVIRVSPDAEVGEEITIQATSFLSAQNLYDNVDGTITLKVAKKNVDLHWDGVFKYGDEPLTLTWDYVNHYSLICVRIKTDDPNAPTGQDRVMIFNSDGKAIRIAADLFGLDLDHDYYISVQVLDYGLDKNAGDYAAKRDEIVAEYNGNLDGNGTYIGDIPSSSKVTVPLLRPQFTVSYNGKDYVGEAVNIKTISALSPSDISCPITQISNTRTDGERVLNEAKCNVYGGKGTDSSAWTPLWTYQADADSYTGTGQVGGLSFAGCSIHNVRQLGIKIDTNNNGAINAIGTYHFVPFFAYSNAPDAARFNVHWQNYSPDYDKHYYYRPESAINFEITGKGNLSLWAFTTSNSFVNGEIYFPTPSDGQFSQYFNLKDTSLQNVTKWNWFQMLQGGDSYGVEFSRMTCQYIATTDAYEIELFYKFYNPAWDNTVEKSAGRFRCDADGKEWSRLSAGTLDKQFGETGQNPIPLYNGPLQIDGSNTSFVMEDNNGNPQNVRAYVPLPSDSAFTNHGWGQFGFTLQKEEEQVITGNGIGFKYQKVGNTGTERQDCSQMACTYDKSTDTYTLKMTCSRWVWDGAVGSMVEIKNVITLTCRSTDTQWTVVK